jgi:hypothetical protein
MACLAKPNTARVQSVPVPSAAIRNPLWALVIGDEDLAERARKRQRAPLIPRRKGRRFPGFQSDSEFRPQGFWISVIRRPSLKIETVPVDCETQRAIAWVIEVMPAAA